MERWPEEEEGTERVHHECVPLVLTLEADLTSQQASGDPDTKAVAHGARQA